MSCLYFLSSAGAFGQRHDAVDHLADGLRGDRLTGGGAVGRADARPEEPHVIVDLGHGGDRRARIARGRLLFDRDCGRQALDMIDVGLLHQFEKLARIGGERFDVAALPLGIDGIEGERGFARSGQAVDDYQLVARNLHIDRFEIVLARAADGDMGQHRLSVPDLFTGGKGRADKSGAKWEGWDGWARAAADGPVSVGFKMD